MVAQASGQEYVLLNKANAGNFSFYELSLAHSAEPLLGRTLLAMSYVRAPTLPHLVRMITCLHDVLCMLRSVILVGTCCCSDVGADNTSIQLTRPVLTCKFVFSCANLHGTEYSARFGIYCMEARIQSKLVWC